MVRENKLVKPHELYALYLTVVSRICAGNLRLYCLMLASFGSVASRICAGNQKWLLVMQISFTTASLLAYKLEIKVPDVPHRASYEMSLLTYAGN